MFSLSSDNRAAWLWNVVANLFMESFEQTALTTSDFFPKNGTDM